MRRPVYFAPLPLLFAMTVLSMACSSPEPQVSGGARFQLSGPESRFGVSCPEPTLGTANYLLADTDASGNPVMLVDGENNAAIRCIVGNGSYEVSVRSPRGFISASGTFAPGLCSSGQPCVSTNARVFVQTTATSYSNQDDAPNPCTLTIRDNTNKGFDALLSCPVLRNRQLPSSQGCAISELNGSYVRFANCAPK